jgi:hypothetical protein
MMSSVSFPARASRLARGDAHAVVPGIGLTRDHLLVMLTR